MRPLVSPDPFTYASASLRRESVRRKPEPARLQLLRVARTLHGAKYALVIGSIGASGSTHPAVPDARGPMAAVRANDSNL